MKKAKIMLTAITILAIVGGALAFRVKADANVYCKQNPGTPMEACFSVNYTTMFVINRPTTTDPCPDETIFYTAAGCQASQSWEETLNTVTQTNL